MKNGRRKRDESVEEGGVKRERESLQENHLLHILLLFLNHFENRFIKHKLDFFLV